MYLEKNDLSQSRILQTNVHPRGGSDSGSGSCRSATTRDRVGDPFEITPQNPPLPRPIAPHFPLADAGEEASAATAAGEPPRGLHASPVDCASCSATLPTRPGMCRHGD